MNSIKLISDGVLLSDAGGAFGLVPRAKWERILSADGQNRVPHALWTPLVEVDGKLILIDCGIGDKFDSQFEMQHPRASQLDELASQGVQPEDIDIVIFTHLHGDHAGWATRRKESGNGLCPTYPNAQYFAQRCEYEDATHVNERTRNTYFADNYVPLFEQGVLTLLDGEAQLTQSVRVVPTPGHTAGHQSVIVDGGAFGGGEPPVFIMGELATYMVHFARLPWVTAYDVLPMQTIETKRTWQRWVFENKATLICAHEPNLRIGRLVEAPGFFQVQRTSPNFIRDCSANRVAER